MVLRRTLPSRLTGAPAPAAAPVAADVVKTETAAAPTPAKEPNTQAAALAAAAATAFAPAAPKPVAAIAPKPAGGVDADFASPVSSTAARVLEESFAPVKANPAPAAAPVEVAPLEGVAEPVLVAPEKTDEPKIEPVQANVEEVASAPVQPQVAEAVKSEEIKLEEVRPLPQAEPHVAPKQSVSAAEVSRPNSGQLRRRVPGQGGGQSANNQPAKVTVTNRPQQNNQPKVPEQRDVAQELVKPAAPKIELPKVEVPKPVEVAKPEPVAEASVAAAPEPRIEANAAPVVAEEKPEALRQARVVKPRDFEAATVVAASAAERLKAEPAPALTLAPDVPVDTRPIDKVNEELIASGIMGAPQGDTLTSTLPGSFAMGEEQRVAPARNDFSLATAPVPPSSMGAGLPWQSEPAGGWHVDMPTQSPPPDVFAPQTNTAFGGIAETPELAPTRMAPPVLPSARPGRSAIAAAGRGKGSWLGTGITVVALGAIGFYVYNQSTQQGGLEKVQEKFAQFAEPGPRLAEVAGVSGTSNLLPPPNLLANGMNVSGTGNTQIGFLDAPADPNAPITGNTDTKMPEDISVFAQLQRAIAEQRANKTDGSVSATEVAAAVAEQAAPAVTKEQVAAELAAYQRALNENPNNPPKPREFFRDPDAFMDGRAANGQTDTAALPDGTLLPPPAGRSATASNAQSNELPPPAELYTNNPNNLPIVAEPVGAQAPRIRQLQDFAAELMAPEERTVKIPAGLRPRMAASDFPSLEVLSFVPGRGVVATADGREGVLLIGESLNGWELTQVTQDVAEFRAGGRSYYLSAQN